MADNNLSVSFESTNEYIKYEGNTDGETKTTTTKKTKAPVPVVPEKKTAADAPIKGFDLEHTNPDDNKPDDSDPEKSDSGEQKQTPKAVKRNEKDITNPTSTLNGTYTDLLNARNTLSAHSSELTDNQADGYTDVSSLVEMMEDVDAAGQKHIDFLTAELPESGLVSGSASYYLERGQGNKSQTYQAEVINSWQNKKKTFGIVTGAAFGYQTNKPTGEEQLELSYMKPKTDGNEDSFPATIVQSGGKTIKTGSFSVNARLKSGNFIYGAGANSIVTQDDTQVHDQHISAQNVPTGISGDLMRRTVIADNPETGERAVKSQMKLKINLFDRGKTDPSGAAYTTDIPVTSAMDLGEENQLRKEIINEADELGQKTIEKKGKGFNLDFEYDDSKCGFIGEYGFDLLKKENQNSKFVVAPVFGVYDYTPPTDEDAESFKGTIGVASEFNKTWADGQSVNASMYAVCNRVVAKGHHPQDTQYLVFKGGYNNPKKKFSVNADAGLVRTNAMNVAYAEADVNYSTKNFDLGLETGYARFKAYGKSDHDYQVALKCKYNIPYKTKK